MGNEATTGSGACNSNANTGNKKFNYNWKFNTNNNYGKSNYGSSTKSSGTKKTSNKLWKFQTSSSKSKPKAPTTQTGYGGNREVNFDNPDSGYESPTPMSGFAKSSSSNNAPAPPPKGKKPKGKQAKSSKSKSSSSSGSKSSSSGKSSKGYKKRYKSKKGPALGGPGGKRSRLKLNEEDTFDEDGFSMNKKLSVSDFQLLKVVGKGSFGKVMMVRKKDDGKIYAMKVLKKKALVKRKQVVHTKTERRVLARIDHPFIVSLRFSFQTPAKLYMILDFFNGGELFFHLKREGRFGESRARFYSGEILLALEFLHNKDIVYRDLKPENILLDQDGHIKITDFGLSKDSLDGDKLTHTFCGTPEYLAPEVLLQQGHGKAVDWWSFGTLLYEMMTGLPPFYDQNLRLMYEKIQFAPVVPPKYFSKNAKTLFFGLLERDPAKRLGSGPRDAKEIREHGFYKPINFDKLFKKEIKPLFKPQVESILDTSNVEDEFTMETPQDTPVIATHSMLDAISAFPGFTYDGDKGGALSVKPKKNLRSHRW